MFAEAAYEAYVGRSGVVFAWDEHQERLRRTLHGIQIPFAEEALAEVTKARDALVRAFGGSSFLLYVQVTGGVAPRLHVLKADPHPAVYATIRPWDRGQLAADQARGLFVITQPDHRWKFATYKTTQLLPNVLAKKAGRLVNADEIVFVSERGTVLEGGATNLFWVERGRLFTAPKSANILPGISRLALNSFLGMPFEEVEAPLSRVTKADEVFLTGTTREVTGVVKVDDAVIGDGRPGKLTRDLSVRFTAAFDRVCPP